MFTALIASFGSLFGSGNNTFYLFDVTHIDAIIVWILMDVYTSSKGRDRGLDSYPGAMIVVQNILIFTAYVICHVTLIFCPCSHQRLMMILII